MRDLFVTLVVLGLLPAVLVQPWIGVMLWSWIGYMNPHRLAYGFATGFPFAMLIALFTMAGLLFSKESKKIPWTREVIILALFIFWMLVTTIFAIHESLAWTQFEKIIKIQVMTFITLMIMGSKKRLVYLVWIIVLSLGFYGIKGGIFTMTSGGGYHVRGPLGTFIGGNNEIGLALIMIIPLMRFLQLQAKQWFIRHGMTVAMLLTFVAVLGTQSRGALLGVAAMTFFMILKSRKKFLFLLLIILAAPIAFSFMPQSWHDRMGTIQNYEQDKSAMGRFDAWQFAFNKALERPLNGGGFEAFAGMTDAHSIYFEVLGEHGFVGLGLFLSLGFLTWFSGSWVARQTKKIEELKWCYDLATMLQVSIIGYAVSGAFLGLAYFDLFYHLVAMMVLTKVFVIKYLDGNGGKTMVSANENTNNKSRSRTYGVVQIG